MSSSSPRAGKKPDRTAKVRLAEQRRRQQRAEARRRIYIAVGSIIGIGAIVGGLVAIKLTHKNTQTSANTVATKPAPTAVTHDLTSISASTLDSVGTNGVTTLPTKVKNVTSLTSSGKPELLYIGAEYCPYCAAERWPMTIALSRFGTFRNLHVTHSSKIDRPANIPTLTYYQSGYSSPYLSFVPRETQTNNVDSSTGTYGSLQQLTKQQTKMIQQYDQPPYMQGQAGGIPFLDFGGRYIWSGAGYDPTAIQSMSWQQIAKAAAHPTTAVGKAIDGQANLLTATLCTMTNDKPSSTCSSSVIQGLEKKISAQQGH